MDSLEPIRVRYWMLSICNLSILSLRYMSLINLFMMWSTLVWAAQKTSQKGVAFFQTYLTSTCPKRMWDKWWLSPKECFIIITLPSWNEFPIRPITFIYKVTKLVDIIYFGVKGQKRKRYWSLFFTPLFGIYLDIFLIHSAWSSGRLLQLLHPE